MVKQQMAKANSQIRVVGRQVPSRPRMGINRCPVCKEILLEALKGKNFAWCDNCTAEISEK